MALASNSWEWSPPSLADFFPPAIFFEGTPFEMNRMVLLRLLSVAVLMVFFWLALRRTRLVPTRLQSLGEMGLDFVRTQIADEVLGERLGRRFLPLLAGTFFGILAMNITAIVPGMNLASTSVFVMPFLFAIASYIAFIYAGIREVGGLRFIKAQLFPAGVPWPIYFILTPVELINIFIVRPLSLALRLTLNMMVGHLLLVLTFSATHWFMLYAGGIYPLLGVVTLVGAIAFTGFELVVIVLQAYVFTLLTAAYIQLSVTEEH